MKTGGLTATAFSGTPKVNDKDIRAADCQLRPRRTSSTWP